MTRDTKTVSAVFMAVLLVLASGTAVSLAVTDGESSAVGSNAAVQETTDVGEETTEVGNDEPTEVGEETEEDEADEGDETDEGDEGDAAEGSANVTINDQESDGERIVIEEVTMEEGGFIAVHDETLNDGDAIGSVVGTSVYLEAGTHENVIVTLGRPVAESQTLIAMPHQDTNDNEVYDFVISGGEADGPYTAADGEAVVDEASVTIGEDEVEETTEVDDVETTEVDDVETTEADDVETTEIDDVETTEVDDVETTEVDDVETTEVDDIETTEVDDVETTEVDDVETTEEDDVETTEEDDVETTEVDDVEETTEVDDVEEPADDQQQLIFKVEQMNIDRWSFVLGDEEEPDRTETVSDITVQDRRVEINLTEMLQEQSEMPSDQVTTQDPEEAQEQVEESLSGDVETVRFVIENVNIENVTFVVTAPEDMELPETPDDMGETTIEEDDDDLVETTTEEDEVIETTTEEIDDVETTEVDDVETTEVDDVETTEVDDVETTEEDDIETTEVDDVETTEVDDVETTEVDDVETTEEDDVETTEEDDEVVETTTEEVDDVETTETDEGEETELESFDVSALNAPDSAEVGDTITVSAVVENPNDVEATQDVAFRLEGTVVAREDVTLNASGSTTVEFEVDTTDVPPGEYVHGVYTRDFGELAVVTLDDPSAEETDDAAETETEVGDEETELPDDEEETELPDDDEETTVAFETTTAEA